MKKIIYSDDDIKNLKVIFTKLFPEYKYIIIKEKNGGIIIKFSITKSWLLNKIIPKLVSNTFQLYELLVTQVPKRLSYRKSEGDTYTNMYVRQISLVANETPEFMCQYLKETIEELPELKKKTFSDVRENLDDIKRKGLEEENELQLVGFFDTSNQNNVVANVLSKIHNLVH